MNNPRPPEPSEPELTEEELERASDIIDAISDQLEREGVMPSIERLAAVTAEHLPNADSKDPVTRAVLRYVRMSALLTGLAGPNARDGR